MRLYDSMSQEKKEFVPRDGDHVTMYFCGPTVYNYVHVGNARPYVVSMVAKRYFESLGYRVTLVENITDIDDRIIQKGIDRGPAGYARWPRSSPRPTATTPTGWAWGARTWSRWPPSTSRRSSISSPAWSSAGTPISPAPTSTSTCDSWPEYGKLSKQQVAEMRHGARIDVGEDKADPLDFALWKGAKPGEPAWDSPWGPGRPGWHIECSAMSLKYLGAGFDIHGGGRDLIFPHHENEIAQAEGALDEPFARFWMHNGMLNLSEEKMSKSVGNILTLRDILDGHRPEALITAFLGSHYRSPLEFSEDLLEETEQQVDRLRNVFRELADRAAARAPRRRRGRSGAGARLAPADDALLEKVAARRQAFDDALADDLNTAAALAEVFGLAREVERRPGGRRADARRRPPRCAPRWRRWCTFWAWTPSPAARTPSRPTSWPWPRSGSRRRAARDFARADALRAAITERGYEVRDVPGGFKIVSTR